MTTSATTHFKLGLFALAAVGGLVASAFVLGFRASRSATIAFHTYFDESVEGLDIGAPVKYRGVRIGSVTTIDVAPDRRWVDVSLALAESDVRRLGLATPAPELRADLSTQGITGVKFIDFDFADPAAAPAPELAFIPAPHYVPSRSSLLLRIQKRTEELRKDVTALMHHVTSTLAHVDVVLDDAHAQHLPARIGELVDRGSAAVAELRRLVAHVDRAGMPEHATAAIDRLTDAATALRGVLDRVGGDEGLVSTSKHAVQAIDDVARGALGSTEELEHTLHELGEAARDFRDLVDALDRDPDMLVKGRARTKGP